MCPKPADTYAPGQLLKVNQGHWDVVLGIREALDDKIVILNNFNITDFPVGFDHEYVNFTGSVDQIKGLQLDAASNRLAICHDLVHEYKVTLASFLIGAGDYAYYFTTYNHGDNSTVAGPGIIKQIIQDMTHMIHINSICVYSLSWMTCIAVNLSHCI